MIEYALLISIGLFSAFMSSISGTGTAIFSMPLLIMLGVPVPAILAANQVSSSVWTPIASRSYLGNTPIRWRLLLAFSGIGVIGVFCGTAIIESIPVSVFKRVMGLVILLVIAYVASRKDFSCEAQEPKASAVLWGIPLGLYQSIFGAASLFSSLVFVRFYYFSLHQALSYAYAVAFPWCLTAAIVFYYKGWIVWSVAIPFAMGSLLGAYLGSKMGSKISSDNLRTIVLILGACMGVRFILLG